MKTVRDIKIKVEQSYALLSSCLPADFQAHIFLALPVHSEEEVLEKVMLITSNGYFLLMYVQCGFSV